MSAVLRDQQASSAVAGSRSTSAMSSSGTTDDPVRALQHVLYRAAKADPGRRFHSLRDKIYRRDVLWRAWVAVRRAQGNLWAEYAPTPARAEYDLMPRLAAVAEIGRAAAPRDHADLTRRLAGHLHRLDAAGITYRPLDPSPT